jgi:hypothetical protein
VGILSCPLWLLFIFILFYFFIYFGDIGIWTQDFVLARQVLYCWVTPSTLFTFVILDLESHFYFVQASLDHNPTVLTLPTIAGMTMCYHAQLFSIEMGSCKPFLCGLASWSQPPEQLGMTGACFCAQLLVEAGGLMNFFAWLALNFHPPDLSLPSS